MLEPVERVNEVSSISLPDPAVVKLNTFANRGSKKDFDDVMELLDRLTLQRMIVYFTEKYPAADPFTVIGHLDWFAVKTRVSRAVAGL